MRERFAWLVFGLVLLAILLALVVAPEERIMGAPQRLMYFHVASAWNAFLAFGIVGLASIFYLRGGRGSWNRIAYSSAEVGVLFTTVTLLSGSFWGRAVWGSWWEWEPQLTTTLILWFIYIGYLLIHGGAESGDRQARVAAVWGILGLIDIPIIYFSVSLWRGLHPASVELDPTMGMALGVSTTAFTFLFAYLLYLRTRLMAVEERAAALNERLRRP